MAVHVLAAVTAETSIEIPSVKLDSPADSFCEKAAFFQRAKDKLFGYCFRVIRANCEHTFCAMEKCVDTFVFTAELTNTCSFFRAI